MELEFDAAIAVLIGQHHKDFYARMLTCMPRRDIKQVDTMAVRAVNGIYELLYNSEWCKELCPEEFTFILHHEMVHICNNHVPRLLRRMVRVPQDARSAWAHKANIAADLAANSQIMSLDGRSPCVKYVFSEESQLQPLIPKQYNLPEGKTFEFYLDSLHDNHSPTEEQEGEEEEASASHKFWDVAVTRVDMKNGEGGQLSKSKDVESMSGTELTELAKSLEYNAAEIVDDAVAKQEMCRGRVPFNVRENLNQRATKYKVPWEIILSNVVRTKLTEQKIRAIQRPRRRGVYPGLYLPGKIRDRSYRCVFIFDTSGSMRSLSLSKGFKTLQDMFTKNDGMSLIAIQADAAVKKVWEVTANEPVPHVYGRGGTDFNPALIESKKHNADVVVYLSDGEAPPPNESSYPRCPVVWLMIPRGYRSHYGTPRGTVVDMEG